MTLYLALTLGGMMTLLFTLIAGVRMQTIRLETEGVMDIGLYSVFGEYNRQLLEQYDLFFIDTTYGEGSPSVDRTKQQLQYYLNENFKKEFTGIGSYRDLTNIQCSNILLEAYICASDEEGRVLKQQIADYMAGKKGLNLLEDAARNLNLIEGMDMDSEEINKRWDETHEQINELLEERRKELAEEYPEEEVEVSIDNPADSVRQTRGGGILEKALPKDELVSAMKLSLDHYFSHREPLVGTGEVEKSENLVESAAERLFLQEYLFEKCGYYGKTLDKGAFAYQLEYILKGKDQDDINLNEVLEDILRIRQVANTTYLFTDRSKQAEAAAVAGVISSILAMPQLTEPVKMTILFAWGYAESVKDVHILLSGNKVPLMKEEGSWGTPLLHLINYTAHLDNYKIHGSGMEYGDYLELFLYLTPEKKILERFMDICEMDIRRTTGNEYFQMDGCLQAIRARAEVTSGYGYSYTITRSYSY